jgi:hypothetical protein
MPDKVKRSKRGLKTAIARFHNVYGPHDAWDGGGREKTPAAMCRKVIEAIDTGKKDITIWGNGKQTRSFMYIDDCVVGIDKIVDSTAIPKAQSQRTRRHRLMKTSPVEKLLGSIPNRLQLAGGWIDQPFVSQYNPKPPGSMVVVQIEPDFRPLDRSGIASGTRAVAMKLWQGKLPNRPCEALARELYEAENRGKSEPSGSQDMIGLVYPGVNRLDYDFKVHGGVFPAHVESCNNVRVAQWLSKVLHLIPVEPRPDGYSPLGLKNLIPKWVAKLGQSGQACYHAIVNRDAAALGASLNLNMKCWETLLPHVVRHPLLRVELLPLLKAYQRQYPGAMYSGCGGGYLIVVSKAPVPGAFKVNVRIAK